MFWPIFGSVAAAVVLVLAVVLGFICKKMFALAVVRGEELVGGDGFENQIAEYKDFVAAGNAFYEALPKEDVYITSFDGLKLYGKYYEYKEGAPIEILVHGYKGNGERDLSGGIERCFKLGHSALVVDQRGAGKSDGHTISFGIKEHLDVVRWAEYVSERFGKDTKIILAGVSMGASTVLMASGKKLPENVAYILADCPYSTPREIIMKTIKEMKLPPKIMYPFVKLGARVFGHFRLDSYSPIEAVQNTKIPIIFIHGTKDDFVPYYMSENMYAKCSSVKKIAPIEDAGHGLAYPINGEKYISEISKFKAELGI